MSTHKRIDVICAVAALLCIVLTALFVNGEALGVLAVSNGEDGSGLFTANDCDGDWDTSTATKITLEGEGGRVSGNGAYFYGGDLYIVYAGRYVLSGELTNGSVIVDADGDDKIWLALDGVSLRCDGGAAIRVEQADKVFLTLMENTENTVCCGAAPGEEESAASVDGAIYSRDDLTVNGDGALTVETAYRHGVVCNDDLVIAGGEITVEAAQDGLHANDSVRIRNASLTISAGDDGITASNDDETAFVYVESGRISIPACYEGIEAINITIAGGEIEIEAADDGINANGRGESSVIRVTGGDIVIVNPSGRDADGLDSNGDIYIEGGRIFISVADSGGNSALDYGVENGGECVISGGTVVACGSSAMAEGFDESSPQGFVMRAVRGQAGATVTLAGSDGNELLSETVPCGFSSILLSVPGLKKDDRCTLAVDGAQEEITVDNRAEDNRGFMGGTRLGGSDFPPVSRSVTDGEDGQSGNGQMPAPQEPAQPEGPWDGQAQETRPPETPEDSPPVEDETAPEEGKTPGGIATPEEMPRPDVMTPPDLRAPSGEMPQPPEIELPDGMEPGVQDPNGEKQEQGDANNALVPEPVRDPWDGGNPGEQSTDTGVSAGSLVLLGVSVVILLLGLVFAARKKRR